VWSIPATTSVSVVNVRGLSAGLRRRTDMIGMMPKMSAAPGRHDGGEEETERREWQKDWNETRFDGIEMHADVRRRRRGNAVTGLQRDEVRGDVGMFCMHVKGMRRVRKGLRKTA
jgi:hypothetical protein